MPSPPGPEPPLIRPATATDADVVAALHADSWREVYRGILPDAYLDGDVDEERRLHWRALLSEPRAGFVLVACHGDVPSGFIAVRRGGEPGYDAVIDSLHVAARWRGSGLGRRLMGCAATRLRAEHASSVCLRVYDANRGAIRFYRRLGGQPDGTGIDPFAGADMPDTRIGWRDLAALCAACDDPV